MIGDEERTLAIGLRKKALDRVLKVQIYSLKVDFAQIIVFTEISLHAFIRSISICPLS